MDIQSLKDACNGEYAQALDIMERGGEAKQAARLLLDAAGHLADIAAADFSLRAECTAKAGKLLAEARKLRNGADICAVYRALTGQELKIKTPPEPQKIEEEETSAEEVQSASTEEVQSAAEERTAERAEVPEKPAADDGGFYKAAKDNAAEQEEEDIEPSDGDGIFYEEEEGTPSLDELKNLMRSGRRGKNYGREDTSGCRFAWDDMPQISFDDVAGLEDVKETVMRKVLLPLKNPELYEGYVKKNGGGLLLYGPPGTGKTMIAAAIAHEIGAKFCSLGPSDLVMQGVGNSEKACVQLFKEARGFPCAVLFFDEMESICPASTHAQGARQLRSELLRQIQGMQSYGEQNDKILFLIAATNKPWDIDPAFVRPGRFGTRIYVGLPDSPARKYMLEKRIAKIMQTGKVLIGGINYDSIVEKTEGFNGADMSNLLDEVQELSALRGAKTGVKEILQEDFDNALKKITTSVQPKDMQKLREWREQNG